MPAPPVANFSVDIPVGPFFVPRRFTDLSTGAIVSRLWDFGGGSNFTDALTGKSTAQVPDPISWPPDVLGPVTVSLTVTGPDGTSTTTATSLVVLTPGGGG